MLMTTFQKPKLEKFIMFLMVSKDKDENFGAEQTHCGINQLLSFFIFECLLIKNLCNEEAHERLHSMVKNRTNYSSFFRNLKLITK
jgi:hypothetical protein